MSKSRKNQLRRLALALLRASAGAVFFAVVLHHVYTLDFRPLAGFCLPILVVFFAFTSLLYMRGRSLGSSREQVRTLFAAERAMQGTVAYLFGVVLGASLYGLLQSLDFHSDPAQPSVQGLWLLVFLAPYALMQTGFFLFIGAVWTIAPQFMRPVSPYEVWRRVAREP
jgi:hypothetical protein